MSGFSHRLGAIALGLAIAALGCSAKSGTTPDVLPLAVTRGDLTQGLLLTGVLDAAKSVELPVPRTDSWQLAIRWLAEDGTVVSKGDKVVEFENSAVLERILELELAVVEADVELAKAKADNAVAVADKQFEVVTQRIEVAKAELDAALPETLSSRREHQDAKLALARAKNAHAAAVDDHEAAVQGGRLDAEVRRIALDKAMRAYRAAEAELDELTLVAPLDGMFTVGTQPWEQRKLQVGDNVWPGLGVGKLPDLSSMIVEGALSDVDDGRVMAGMRVRCTVDAYADRPLEGSIRQVSPVAHAADKSLRRFFALVVELDDADPEIARPGLSVKIEVLTRAERDAVIVPRAGLDRSTAPARARLVSGQEVDVEVDFCTAHACAVLAGLEVGDQVVPLGGAS